MKVRRVVCRWWLVGLAAVLIAAPLISCRPAPSMARGPIVLISIDTLRADRLAVYGYGRGRTPRISGLAQDSVVFDRAYTHVPLTLPAHVSLLSGQLPAHHGVRDNVGFRVKPGRRLLPSWLRERGYATAGVVSTAVLREATGIAATFDFYDGRMPPARGGAALDEAHRTGESSLNIARTWVRGRSTPDWFLFFHIYEPHAPYESYRDLHGYDGDVARADEVVGMLLDDLRSRGLYDSATIVLLSDHGEGLGDHGEQEHGLFLYEETVRVPLLIKVPNQRNAGSRVAAVVQHIDVLPTLLDLAGAAVPSLPGRSLRPLLDGDADGWPERGVYTEALFGRYQFGWSELFALTDSRFRFIKAPRPELYDLQTDSSERQNLVESRRPTATAMHDALMSAMNGAAVDVPEAIAPEVRERLVSLGYVGPQTGAAHESSPESRPDPKDKVGVLVRYRTAMAHVAEGRLADAVEILRQLGRDEPSMADVWLTVGRLLQRLGRSHDAVEALKEYVRQKPTGRTGLLELASVFLALEQFQQADAHAELAAKASANEEIADQLGAYEMLVRIALARGDQLAARATAALAAKVDPTFPLRGYVDGRLAYAARQFDAASSFFERAVEESRTNTLQIRGLHLYAGDTYAHLERFADAEREFRDEIQFFPDSMWAYLSLANLHQAFGRFDEADRVLAAMLIVAPSAEAHAQAAKLRSPRAAAGEKP